MPDLTQITSPSGVKFTVAKDAADAFGGFLADLEGSGYKINPAESGGYANRNIAGTNTPSQHAFGRAIDINWQDNPRGANTPSNLPPNIGDIAASHGLVWGGSWSGDTRDPMHFEVGGKPMQVASNDDLLARMQRLAPVGAPQPATGATTSGPAQGAPQDTAPSSDDLMARMNAIAPPSTKTAPPTAAPAQGTTLPGPGVPSADQQSADTGLPLPASPGPNLPQGGSDLANALEPAPNTTYASILPLARDDKTGEIRYGVLPSLPRELLLGAVQGVRDIFSGNVGAQTTVDPATGKIQYGMTPGANLLLSAGARPLEFSGGKPLQFVSPGTLQRAPLPSEAAANLLSPDVAARSRSAEGTPAVAPTSPTGVPETAPPAPTTPAPSPAPQQTGAPQPAGAQVSPSDTLQLTPREAANTQLVADLQWLTKTKQPGVVDPNVYLEGITPTKAQIEQTVQSAREIKELKLGNPAVAQEDEALADLHNDIRKRAFGDVASSQLLTDRAIGVAGDKIESDLAKVWQNKGEADTTGVTKQISNELSGSAGDLPPMRNGLKQIQDSVDAAGTDPQQLYKARRLVNYFQSKQAARENPSYGDADFQRSLVRVKAALDQAIEPAAPGFQQAMSDYSTTMGPLTAQKELQARELGLQNSKGVMEYNRVHNLMRDVVVGRSPDTPTNPFQGLSDQQMDALKAIHDDLQRVATAKQLAAASGSDTAQNIVGLIKQYAKMGAGAGVHGVANYMAPGVGSMAVRSFGRLVEPITAARTARRQVRAGMEALHPDLSKYPGGNPLNQP